MRLKTAVRALANRCGFDIVRLRHDALGLNPLADMQRFLAHHDAPLICDVGANYGQSVRAFKQAFPRSTIHSFEPSPTTFQALSRNCRELTGVSPWNCGVGSSNATLTFHENENPDMSSFLTPGATCWGKVVRSTDVPVVTLDSFAATHGIEFVHLLKSDTQGYDFEVFKGAAELMRQNRIGMIYFEFIFSDMYASLPRFDEVFRFLIDRRFALVSFYDFHFQNDLASWTDALFINSDFHSSRDSSNPIDASTGDAPTS
jgi:FkbM family methyltransferase